MKRNLNTVKIKLAYLLKEVDHHDYLPYIRFSSYKRSCLWLLLHQANEIGSMSLGSYCNKPHVRILLFVTKMGHDLDYLTTDNRNIYLYFFIIRSLK